MEDSLVIGVIAVSTIALGVYRSKTIDSWLMHSEDGSAATEINDSAAMAVPVVASIGLLLFYYYFSLISFITTLFVGFTSSFAIVFSIYPFFEIIFTSLANKYIDIPFIGQFTALSILLYPFSTALVFLWLITGHWICNNVIAVSLCVIAISSIRIPSLKIASILLVSLFFYDIFWVFYSSNLFGENVMVEVAIREASNPAVTVVEQLNIPIHVTQTLQLPSKLIWGDMLLGNGDVVMPGILAAFAYRFDSMEFKPRSSSIGPGDMNVINTKTNSRHYYISVMIGYIIGLFISMSSAIIFNYPQPALLYIVPCIMLPLLVIGIKKSEIRDLWKGLPQFIKNDNEKDNYNKEY